MLSLITAVLAIMLLLVFIYRQFALKRRLPPGPRPLPVLGNVHQIPKSYPWRSYSEMFSTYGPIFSMQFGLQTVVMIGSASVARDLLDRRNSIYSSRPRSPMVQECISKNLRILFLPYGERWRNQHKLHASVLNIRMVENYQSIQDLESRRLIFHLSRPDAGERFPHYFYRYSTSLIHTLAYGIHLPKGDEPELEGVDRIMRNLNSALLSTWLVDIIPWFNLLPTPLATWKTTADKMHNFERPFLESLAETGETKPGWNWSKHFQKMKTSENMSRTEIAYALGVLNEAGSDTTAIALQVLVMAAVLFPECAQTAQDELDRVVGSKRLPVFKDLVHLPYIEAMVKEILRWRPVIPGGVPHAVTRDDKYKGYHIPKGATVVPVIWSMGMDEDIFDHPQEFRPDRWLENPQLPLSAFGFGKRVCPGQHLGKSSLLINTARIMWAFKFEHAYEMIDGTNTKCSVDPMAYTNAFNSEPLPFKVSITIRNPKAQDIMEQEWANMEKDYSVHLEHLETMMHDKQDQ